MPTPTHDRADREGQRIRAALVSLVAEHGYRATTLDQVLQLADLDLVRFHRHYADFDACFAAVWEGFKQQFLTATADAYRGATNWTDGMRAAAWAYCRFLQEDHDRARLFLVELNFANEVVQASRDVVMSDYTDLVHEGRHQRPEAAAVPRARAEAILGALWEGAVAAVQADNFDYLPSVIPQAMYLTVLPYLGAGAAQEELRRGPADIARYERGEI